MCQHDFQGRRVFQHRNLDKWSLFGNKRVKGFWFEDECRQYLDQLRRLWNGAIAPDAAEKLRALTRARPKTKTLRIRPVMISCIQRRVICRRTLESFGRTDWADPPVRVQLDESRGVDYRLRQTRCAYLALKESLGNDADYILFLEDDLDFNRHIHHNLQNWAPLRTGKVTVASLYNPAVRESGCDPENNALLVKPTCVFGSQAFLISMRTLEYIIHNWDAVRGMQDIRISRLAGRLDSQILYHAPSLVQHIGKRSTWGGGFHQAMDFDSDWRA
jgi:hypothetical protein